jgi:GntR family transcriptional regulator
LQHGVTEMRDVKGRGHEPSIEELSQRYMLDNGVTPNRFATRPLYLQARDAIAQRIAAGEWKPHSAIPNESELAREFGVSAGTMRKALDLAQAERLLTRRQGRGTFVNDPSSDEYVERYNRVRDPTGGRVVSHAEELSLDESVVDECAAVRLQLHPRERVLRIRRLWRSGGRPYMIEHVTLPSKLFPGLAGQERPSQRLAVLAQQFGVLLGGGEERITIDKASPEVAAALEAEAGETVMALDRVVYTLQGRPAEWRVGQCRMDGKHYLVQFS